MPLWEYKVLTPTNAEHELNELGREGWELVAVTANFRYVLKRPISN